MREASYYAICSLPFAWWLYALALQPLYKRLIKGAERNAYTRGYRAGKRSLDE